MGNVINIVCNKNIKPLMKDFSPNDDPSVYHTRYDIRLWTKQINCIVFDNALGAELDRTLTAICVN